MCISRHGSKSKPSPGQDWRREGKEERGGFEWKHSSADSCQVVRRCRSTTLTGIPRDPSTGNICVTHSSPAMTRRIVRDLSRAAADTETEDVAELMQDRCKPVRLLQRVQLFESSSTLSTGSARVHISTMQRDILKEHLRHSCCLTGRMSARQRFTTLVISPIVSGCAMGP